MEKIEELLAEYRIRFRDTERIKEDGYPFKRWQMATDLGEEEFTPYVYGDVIINRYGTVYGKGVWATADLKEAPDKWVVEKDKNHPMWSKFARETGWHIEGDCDLPAVHSLLGGRSAGSIFTKSTPQNLYWRS